MEYQYNKKVIIVCYRGYSGGILALSLLCKLLVNKGIDARIFYVANKPKKNEKMWKYWIKWTINEIRPYLYPLLIKLYSNKDNKHVKAYEKYILTPFEGLPIQRTPFFSKEKSIIIYPDSVYGNFLHGKNIVRWFLYFNPFQNDNKAYGKDDLFIAYREVFYDKNVAPEKNIITISHFDHQLYNHYNKGPRKGNCYIIRKGRFRKDLPKEFDGPIIDDLSEQDKVKVLNECEYCYSYDLQTFYSTIAAVCGCISVIVFEPGKTAEDYYSTDEINNHVGVAYGNTKEEILFAKDTIQDIKEKLDYSAANDKAIDTLIKLLREKFNFQKIR